MPGKDEEFYLGNSFALEVDSVAVALFTEVSGLESATDVTEIVQQMKDGKTWKKRVPAGDANKPGTLPLKRKWEGAPEGQWKRVKEHIDRQPDRRSPGAGERRLSHGGHAVPGQHGARDHPPRDAEHRRRALRRRPGLPPGVLRDHQLRRPVGTRRSRGGIPPPFAGAAPAGERERERPRGQPGPGAGNGGGGSGGTGARPQGGVGLRTARSGQGVGGVA